MRNIELSITGAKVSFSIAPAAIACWLASGGSAVARVGAEGCDDFVGDRPLAGEALNDTASYAFPEHWREWWDQGGTGARLSAGSLNAREFLYTEDLRFEASSPGSSLSLFLDRALRQNHWQENPGTELNLNIAPAGPGSASFSILMDSDATKKNADLGVAAGWRQSLVSYSEVFLWSIDHYYNTKETSGARWTTKPMAWGYRFSNQRPEGGAAPWLQHAQIEIQPKAVYRSTAGSDSGHQAAGTCSISRQSISMRGEIAAHLIWDIAQFHSRKESAVETTDTPKIHVKRDTASAGVTWVSDPVQMQEGGGYDSVRLQVFVDQLRRDDASVSGARREAILSARRQFQGTGAGQWFVGIVGSRGQQEFTGATNEDPQSIEQAKLQTGFEYQIGRNSRQGRPKGSFRTLANWDLDHLLQDFPYRKRQFRPWDGGLLQFSFYN